MSSCLFVVSWTSPDNTSALSHFGFGCAKDAAGFFNRDETGGATAVLPVEAADEGVRRRHVHLELDVAVVAPGLLDLLDGRVRKRIFQVTKGWCYRLLVRARKGKLTGNPRRTAVRPSATSVDAAKSAFHSFPYPALVTK